jgi:hypothetical protein
VHSVLKRILVGSPPSSAELEEQRLTKRVALAVFGTDAIASTAFHGRLNRGSDRCAESNATTRAG